MADKIAGRYLDAMPYFIDDSWNMDAYALLVMRKACYSVAVFIAGFQPRPAAENTRLFMPALFNATPQPFQKWQQDFLATLSPFLFRVGIPAVTAVAMLAITIARIVTKSFEWLRDMAPDTDFHSVRSFIKRTVSRGVASGREVIKLPRLQTVCHSQEYSTK